MLLRSPLGSGQRTERLAALPPGLTPVVHASQSTLPASRSLCAATTTLHAAESVPCIPTDDLGRQDLGFRNNFTTYTPAINRLRADGVWLDSHHA